MSNIIKTYSTINLKSPTVYFWFLIMFCISIIGAISTYVLIRDGYWKVSLISFLFILPFPYILFYTVKAKIILTEDSIIKKNIFKTTEIKFSEVKTFNIFESARMGHVLINESDLKNWWTLAMIFISTEKKSNPNKFSRKKSINFHVTDDVYQRLKEKINITE